MPTISLDDYEDLGPLEALIARTDAEFGGDVDAMPDEAIDAHAGRIWTPGGYETVRAVGTAAARAFLRELEHGPDPEADLEPSERTERWERARVLGSMPERMLQRETRMGGHGGGGRDSTGRAKDARPRERRKGQPDAPVIGWAPGPQLAIWVTRGTGEYFQRAPLDESLRAVTAHVEQLTAARAYPDRPLPKRKRRSRLLVIRGANLSIASIAKKNRAETSEALFEWALAHAATLVRSLDGIGGA